MILYFTGQVVCAPVRSQCPTGPQLWTKLIGIETDTILSQEQKLKEVFVLKKTFEDCRLARDSVYARILHRIGVFQYNTTRELDKSIRNTLESVSINTSGEKGACLRCAVRSYTNLGYYYEYLLFFDQALRYFDSAALLAGKFAGQETYLLESRQERSNIFDKRGDFQKCTEEAARGLHVANTLHDTTFTIVFLNQRAFAYAQQRLYQQAKSDASLALSLSALKKNNDGKAGSLKVQAMVMESGGEFPEALNLYNEAIKCRMSSDDPDRLAEDYLDAGNLLLYKMGRYNEAKKYCLKTVQISLAQKDYNTTANAYNSIGSFNFFQGHYAQALYYYRKALDFLPIATGQGEMANPGSGELNRFQNKQVLLHPFGNKTECLLHLYKQTGQPDYLTACLRTALLTDSLISAMRHEQTGEQTKLYWRNQTREFFGNALEACWLARDTRLAFYFMEKSRAVLLNDKLNELGAFALLPGQEAAKEQSLQINIIGLQQTLSQLSPDSPAYQSGEIKLLQAKDEFEKYIKTLEQTAPAYYQYKYADEVPALDSFQRFLAIGRQSFIHYFINDTVVYILAISPLNARLLKLPYSGVTEKLGALQRICADEQQLNQHYGTYAALSNSIYRTLFEPLHLPKGRVVICQDNFIIPFEALCTDSSGRKFLLYDYVFDYVYSARYLLKPFTNPEGKGNFLGVAPATFADYLHVPDLRESITSIRTAASWYSGTTCKTGKGANRRYFMEESPGYTIVNVYSHARADSGDQEPLLFMSDSVIHLSELQLLQRPATQLVVLSACQTNAGKNATGEGIYSLARGFSTAGIPAVASTLWQADEKSTYAITELFHRNLSQGMRKDEALQKAKLEFIRSHDGEELLPYYWANMILIGNAEPIKLRTVHSYWWVGLGAIGLLILLLFGVFTGFFRRIM